MVQRFADRSDAGAKLAAKLQPYAHREGTVVLALPRGGVPVGFRVAEALDAPLDIFMVRKLGVPGYEELAMGAVASGGVVVVNREVAAEMGIPHVAIEAAARRELAAIAEKERTLRGDLPSLDVAGKTIVIVDDGLATGSTMRAAVRALRRKGPASIAVAVPVAHPETCEEMRAEADEVVCIETPGDFSAVGDWYEEFEQTSDGEVRELIERAARRRSVSA
jgi:putative phosphoribosyl transferase